MILHGDFYWVPVLPKDMRAQISGGKKNLSKEMAAEYRRLRAAFTKGKDEFIEWASRDRHRLMNKAAKAVLALLARRLNFDTGRCDPSQAFIAEELGMGLRSVERAIKSLVEAGWIAVHRRGLTTTNFYRLRVAAARIEAIKADLAERKALRLAARQMTEIQSTETFSESTDSSVHPSEMAGQEQSKLAGQEPPLVADKPMNRTSENEPLNEKDNNRREGNSLVEVEIEAIGNPPATKRSADVIDFPSHPSREPRRPVRLPDKTYGFTVSSVGRR